MKFKLNPERNGTISGAGKPLLVSVFTGTSSLGYRCAWLSGCLLKRFINTPILFLLPELRGVYQFAFPFFFSRSLSEAEPLPTSPSCSRAVCARAQMRHFLLLMEMGQWECSRKAPCDHCLLSVVFSSTGAD